MDQTLLRIGICSTYAPRACGLATFAADLEEALRCAPGVGEVHIIQMENEDSNREGAARSTDAQDTDAQDEVDVDRFPDSPVIESIKEDEIDSYAAAAKTVNALCDVVIVQHEFGIFGGVDGAHLLRFLDALDVPIVMTLHTVLPSFTPGQAAVLRAACQRVDAVTVFTETARRLLVEQQIVWSKKIQIVPHGAPALLFTTDREIARQSLDVQDRFLLSTFGLVSPGKGLDLVIEALPKVVEQVPNALLIIAGRTHPGVRRREGERYREDLADRIGELGVAAHVRFVNEFLPVPYIAELLASTDVFVTPYVNLDQIVSGVLTFALAAGCPVVSTNYRYAQDQLSAGAGAIVENRDPELFADSILGYALDAEANSLARMHAQEVGASMHWSAVGLQTALLCRDAVRSHSGSVIPLRAHRIPNHAQSHSYDSYRNSGARSITTSSPTPSGAPLLRSVARITPTAHPSYSQLELRHLERLVDDTGIIQHATGIVPLLVSGYCVDDVARLIPVAMSVAESNSTWESVVARSVAFLGHAASEVLDGSSARLNNFLSWNRTWLDTPHFGDHVGRAMLGLSYVAGNPQFCDAANPLLQKMLRDFPVQSPLHPIAYALLAQAQAQKHAPWLTDPRQLSTMLSQVVNAYRNNREDNWEWFEPTLRYDNALFPHALMAAGALAGDPYAIEVGLQTLRWYDNVCDQGSYYRFPGHRGLAKDALLERSGDEQPLEALALAQAHACAFEITNDATHLDRVLRAHEWFVGRNRLGAHLVESGGGCSDGLGESGVNHNQGAESTLAYCASHQLVSVLGVLRKQTLFAQPEEIHANDYVSTPTLLGTKIAPVDTLVRG